MNFDAIGFGKELYNIRNTMNLTIEETGFLSDVNEKTIYRLENGKNKASRNTLNQLSKVYKKDLFSLLYKHMDNPMDKWNKIVETTENQLYIDDMDGISYGIEELRKLPLNEFNLFDEINIMHYIGILESTYFDIKEKSRSLSIERLEHSLKFNIPYFNLVNYKNYNYSPMEIRLIMNLATLKYYMTKNNFYRDILSHLLSLDLNDVVITPKIILNLASMYQENYEYNKVLSLVNYGITYCIKNQNLQALPKLYFRKFVGELNLDFKCYMESLNKAIFTAEINNQEFLKQQFISSAYRYYNIKLDYLKNV